MIVEVIAVGTELLLGQIVNTNGAHLGQRLAESGFDAHFQTVVGDNLERIAAAIRIAEGRADAVILVGGLGPTPDDLTREAIAAVMGVPLDFDEEYAAQLAERFGAVGRRMPPNNLRQAQLPRGSELLANPKGTAPGLAVRHGEIWLFAVPGVPAEMEAMIAADVIPRLAARRRKGEVLVSRVIRSWGRSESAVSELLDDLYTASTNPSVAFLASAGEIKVRLTAKAPTKAVAEQMLGSLEADVRERLGSSVFGADEATVELVLLEACRERDWSLGTAESATAGLVGARIVGVPGASTVFRGSLVTYAADLKQSLLGIPAGLMDSRGVVSEEVALAMAEGGARALAADVVIAVTGSAGPEELEQPAGTMIVAIRTPEDTRARTLRMPGDRERVRTYTATAGLHLARLAVQGTWW